MSPSAHPTLHWEKSPEISRKIGATLHCYAPPLQIARRHSPLVREQPGQHTCIHILYNQGQFTGCPDKRCEPSDE